VTAALPAVAAVAAPALAAVSKALLLGVAASWAHCAFKDWLESMKELFNFSPHRLHLQYLPGTEETGPLEARRYTLTHSDRTGELQLSIGQDWHHAQFSGWYKKLMRDEVLAEWRGAAAAGIIAASAGLARTASGGLARTASGGLARAASGGLSRDHRHTASSADAFSVPAGSAAPEQQHPHDVPSLHVYCHVSASTALEIAGAVARIPWPPAPPRLRAMIFQKDMPLVLAALSYAERRLLQTTPVLAAAPVYVHLKSHLPELDQVVHWGRFGDPASWGPQPAAAPVPIPVEEQQ
jgi:hypothetical protein